MRRCMKALIPMTLVSLFWLAPLYAQEEYGEDSKLNTNLALAASIPLNPLGQFTNFGWGTTVGAGYNFNRNNSLIGEFLWNRINPTSSVMAPIRLALSSPNVNGHANLYALTANYRFELRGRKMGTYFIAGGGVYHRNASLSQEVPNGTATTCTSAWGWWGFSCSSGVVTKDVTLASSASTAFGVNGGIGFTVKVGDPRYRMYVEARYHYAPNMRISTQIIPVTMGIRF
jgi:opacity protein-like surface antigen